MIKKALGTIYFSAFAPKIVNKNFHTLSKQVFNPFKNNSTAFLQRSYFSSQTVNVPSMGDSITDGVIFKYEKAIGDYVEMDDLVAIIETEKVKVDIRSTQAGALTKLHAEEGDTVEVGKALFDVDTSAPKPEKKVEQAQKVEEKQQQQQQPQKEKPKPQAQVAATQMKSSGSFSRNEKREKMTRMRSMIAKRLKEGQNTYAQLTTFQEVDMSAIMDLRNAVQNDFVKKHNVKLGFMSFFLKASTLALQDAPIMNAVINGDEIIYRDYVDISVAVAAPSGLLVPVIRNCESLNFPDYERQLIELAKKGKEGKITADEMAGGTFTISNGGVFGSLMGTPLLNTPQSALLGMHAIINRPVVRGENIVARPMMYLAMTYDHRLIDGREAATFLKKIQTLLEDPRKMLLDL